ncbi:MAG: hypothetical protein ACI4OI_02590, partial [Gemmiger sp.]
MSAAEPVRRLPRLRGYDYSSHRYYFVTICTKGKEKLFSRILETPPACPGAAQNRLTPLGIIASEELLALPERFPGVVVENYVIMPNHL